MRRALIALVATVAGVAWILGYKVEPHTAGIASAGPGATNSGPATTQPAPAPTTAPGTGGISGTFTGADVPNRFGDVQVRVVISNGRITDLQAVQLPADRARSAYISQVSGPLLRTEVLQAQSARIDIVSGATYTSQSYAQSVESALQQAHLG